MTCTDKDLFRELFERTSKHSFDFYRHHFLERLPYLLLQTAQQSAPEIMDCAGFGELLKYLAVPTVDAQSWKNAELYPYLNYVAFPNNCKRQVCIEALRVHCGLEQLTYNTNPDVRYWRFPRVASGRFVEVAWFNHRRLVRNFSIGWNLVIRDKSITVFRPYICLFDDVEPSLYGAQSSSRSNNNLECLLKEVFSLIYLYSASLCNNILDQISTISLLREIDKRPISYSLRNRYIGAIFITIASPIEMAEQIIHEYYHQSIWPWWLVEPPEDLPDPNLQVISPITGAVRSLPTMIQAILIYIGLIDFYTFASKNFQAEPNIEVANRVIARTHIIREGFNDLAVTVADELKAMPASSALVGTIIQIRHETLIDN
ncbi:hypothetical protein LT980_14490 [Citrobacter portucalensis]|uniref:hypothetical protein n=1 Tax=Citrobacter portucalensis TaxID=1639133 RepID=UPI00202CF1C6|nr:hypothetical protein [Citrobacter portucalensis]URR11153.1 hypothetical protein LT980_14490 [Citrobacter portucalensis]